MFFYLKIPIANFSIVHVLQSKNYFWSIEPYLWKTTKDTRQLQVKLTSFYSSNITIIYIQQTLTNILLFGLKKTLESELDHESVKTLQKKKVLKTPQQTPTKWTIISFLAIGWQAQHLLKTNKPRESGHKIILRG